MSTGLNDNEIISEVLNGNQQAYAVLVNRYQNYVFTLCLRIVKGREDAEEVAQDVFIKAYKYLADFRGAARRPRQASGSVPARRSPAIPSSVSLALARWARCTLRPTLRSADASP